MEALTLHKQQHEALGSQVKTFTNDKKKEKENVFDRFGISEFEKCCFVEFRRAQKKDNKGKKKTLMEEKQYQNNLQQLQTQLEIAEEQKKSLDLMVLRKGWRIMNRCCNIIP